MLKLLKILFSKIDALGRLICIFYYDFQPRFNLVRMVRKNNIEDFKFIINGIDETHIKILDFQMSQ